MKLTALPLLVSAVVGARLALPENEQVVIKTVKTFRHKQPSFLSFQTTPGTNNTNLWITSFGAIFGKGNIAHITVSELLSDSEEVEQIFSAQKFGWPNEARMVPEGALPFTALAVPDGFLVPGKSTGAVYLLPNPEDVASKAIKITTDKKGYFYHMTQWMDVDGDGLVDCVTARGTKGIFSSGGELLWLKQPQTGAEKGAWEEHVLTAGPDVMFAIRMHESTFEVFAAQFFTKSLSLYSFDLATRQLQWSRDIETSIGALYDLHFIDLNNDGIEELLASSHNPNLGGSVYAYDIPSDIANGEFVRHTLATGFKVKKFGIGQGSPGFLTPFHPKVDASLRPHIVVAGDGSEATYLMSPTGNGLKYTTSVLLDQHGVVGIVAVGDIDNNGYADLAVPNYDHGTVTMLKYVPV